MQRSFWIIWVELKHNYVYSYDGEAEEEWTYTQSRDNSIKMYQRNIEDAYPQVYSNGNHKQRVSRSH